jgi:transposase-like protein
MLGSLPPLLTSPQYGGPREPDYGIPLEEWPNVVRQVIKHHASLRQVAAAYGVSHETIRRILRASRTHRAG